MNTFSNKIRRFAAVAAAIPLVMAMATASAEELGTPSGEVYFSGSQFGLILQVGSGGGQLVFKGGHYPFDMGGLKLGANIGTAHTKATGQVYNLTKLADFEGTYTGTAASLTVAGGGGGIWLQNEKGVKLNIQTEKIGAELTLATGGASLTFWDSVKDLIAKNPDM